MRKKAILRLLSCCLAGILLVETPIQVNAVSADMSAVSEVEDDLETFVEEPKGDASEENTEVLEDDFDDLQDETEKTEEQTEEKGEALLTDTLSMAAPILDDQEVLDSSVSSAPVLNAPDGEIPAVDSSEDPMADIPLEDASASIETPSTEEPDPMIAYLTLSAPQYGSIPEYSEDFDSEEEWITQMSEALADTDTVDISSYGISSEELEDGLNWLVNNEEICYTFLPYVEYAYIEDNGNSIVQNVTVSKMEEEELLSLTQNLSEDGVILSFTPVDGVDEYRLFKVTSGGVEEVEVNADDCSAVVPVSFEDQTAYQYVLCGYKAVEEQLKVCAFSKFITIGYQSETLDTVLSASIPVPELTFTSKDNVITLHWKALDGVDGYILYEVEGENYTKKLEQTADTSLEYEYEIEPLEFGEKVWYAISAYVSSPIYAEGNKSAALEISRGFDSVELEISSVSYKEVKIEWTQVLQADGYILERKTASGEYEELATITSGSKTSYTDSNIVLNETYYYRIRAYKKNENGVTSKSEPSNEVSVTPALSAGKITSVTGVDYRTLKISWNKVDGADGYKIYRSTAKDGTYDGIKTITSGDTLSYQNSGVVPGITYYYKIRPYRAVDGVNVYGEYSAVVGKAAALGKVTGVKAVSAAYNAVNLSWSKVAGASGYVIERSETSSFETKTTKTITSGSTLSYKISSLTFNKKYYYRIRAYYTQEDGKKTYGSYSSVVSAAPVLPASKISSVNSVNYNTVKITWAKVTGATGYKVYRSTSSDGTYSAVATIKSGSTVSYQNTGLTMDKTYYYKVRAYRTVDGKDYYGAYSSIVKGTPKLGGVTGTKAASASYNSVKVSWSKVAGASGYVVYYSGSKDSGYKTLKTVTSTSYTHTGLTSGKMYYYKVRAYRTVSGKKVYGAYSSVASAKPIPATVTAKRSTVTYNSIKITWSKINGANGYEVYRSGSKNGTYTKIKTITDVNTLSFTNGGLTTEKTYYYKVRAYRTVSGKKVYGAYSAVVSGTPKLKTTVLKKESQTYNSLKMSWKKIDGASGYEIYRSTSKSGTYKNVKTITSSSTLSWTNSGLTTGKTYYYKVRPYRTINGNKVYGEFSELISVKPVLSKVTSFKATPTGNSSIKLTWKKVTGATGYVIERSTSKEGTYSKLKTITSGTTESYTNNVSTYGQTYYYKIYAVRDDFDGTKVGPVGAMASIMNLSDTSVTVKVGSTVKIAAAVVPSATISWSSADSKVAKVDSNGKITGVGPGTTTIYAKANGLTKSVKVTVKGQYKGIDVSSYQGTINWKKVADDGIDFAMIRVITGSSSSTTRDTMFKENYDGARDNGIKVGLYRYSYATSRTKAREEAQNIIDTLHGRKLDYPIVMDMEDSSILSGTNSNARRSEIVLAFKEVIEDAGYDFALYANTTWLNNYLDMDMLKDVDLWIARWRSVDQGHGYTGKGNVVMWQYSSSGSVNGINGKVDMNLSYKNY